MPTLSLPTTAATKPHRRPIAISPTIRKKRSARHAAVHPQHHHRRYQQQNPQETTGMHANGIGTTNNGTMPPAATFHSSCESTTAATLNGTKNGSNGIGFFTSSTTFASLPFSTSESFLPAPAVQCSLPNANVANTKEAATGLDSAKRMSSAECREMRRLAALLPAHLRLQHPQAQPAQLVYNAAQYIAQLTATVVARVQNGTLPKEALASLFAGAITPNDSRRHNNNGTGAARQQQQQQQQRMRRRRRRQLQAQAARRHHSHLRCTRTAPPNVPMMGGGGGSASLRIAPAALVGNGPKFPKRSWKC